MKCFVRFPLIRNRAAVFKRKEIFLMVPQVSTGHHENLYAISLDVVAMVAFAVAPWCHRGVTTQTMVFPRQQWCRQWCYQGNKVLPLLPGQHLTTNRPAGTAVDVYA